MPILEDVSFFLFFSFLKIYLFIHERHTEREAETQAEREAGSMQGAHVGLDLGLQDYALGQRQMLNC